MLLTKKQQISAQLDAILATQVQILALLTKENTNLMAAIDDLKAAVAALNTSISAEIAAIAAAIAAAAAGNAGSVAAADAEAIVTQLGTLKTTIDTETAKLAPVAPPPGP